MTTRSTLLRALPLAALGALLLPIAAFADANGSFSVTGTSGTESPGSGSTNPTGNGCQFGGTCVVDTNGTANVMANTVSFAATYSSVLTIDYSRVTNPSPNVYCAPATGTVTITSTANSADQIFKSEQGQVCGNNAAGAPHSFQGTFTITGGGGQFNGATGSGTSTLQDNGSGTVTSSQESGTIAVPPPANAPEVPAAMLFPMMGAAVVGTGAVWQRVRRKA